MEHINGYDEYENDFRSVARPEYKWLAEQMLLEALEISDRQNFIELYMHNLSNSRSKTFPHRQDMPYIVEYIRYRKMCLISSVA